MPTPEGIGHLVSTPVIAWHEPRISPESSLLQCATRATPQAAFRTPWQRRSWFTCRQLRSERKPLPSPVAHCNGCCDLQRGSGRCRQRTVPPRCWGRWVARQVSSEGTPSERVVRTFTPTCPVGLDVVSASDTDPPDHRSGGALRPTAPATSVPVPLALLLSALTAPRLRSVGRSGWS